MAPSDITAITFRVEDVTVIERAADEDSAGVLRS